MAEREDIRSRLKKHQLTQVWLINQLGLRGIVTDKTEMSSVLAGTRSGSKADAIIELSHDILDKYEGRSYDSAVCRYYASLPLIHREVPEWTWSTYPHAWQAAVLR